MNQSHPDHAGFTLPEEQRRVVTEEPSPSSTHHDPAHQDVDWIGHRQQGGGSVPVDLEWKSNPKQDQDESSCG